MKAFWWFDENVIAGMARPGFNKFHWYDLSFDEAAVLGWLGQHGTGTASLKSFHHHLATYVPKMFKFHKMDEQTGHEFIQKLKDPNDFSDVLTKLIQRTNVFETFNVHDHEVHLKLNNDRLIEEVEFLKDKGIKKIVTLTEDHHSKDTLAEYFSVHHIAIEDLGAPTVNQAHELADIVQQAKKDRETLAVHCLAGIGRTSTMIAAAHMILGENLDNMVSKLAKQNPSFTFSGPQGDFLKSLDLKIYSQ